MLRPACKNQTRRPVIVDLPFIMSYLTKLYSLKKIATNKTKIADIILVLNKCLTM